MCGITGIYAFNLIGKFHKIHVTAATSSLQSRGPDTQDIFLDEWVALGHRRLSVIDTSPAGNQPMWDVTNRYCIVYNGEIFNFRELREQLLRRGVVFRSHTDTEVLLHLYILEGERCLEQLNGFFAFCIFDQRDQSLFLARDRFGIKPLLYVFDEDKFLFASEMKALLHYGIDKAIDYTALYTYLQLNYIPAPDTIFGAVKKLMPGHYLRVSRQHMEVHPYYQPDVVSARREHQSMPYDEARQKLVALLDEAVQRRLVADVPLGSFLSGGIDSSVITALAHRHKKDLHTFSIGYKQDKFFDETRYANLVARHLGTKHQVFSLSHHDLFIHVNQVLDYLDEPFADSSAIAVYILSRETRKAVTVALSGDGADELFGGYNKHMALLRSLRPGWKERFVSLLQPFWKRLPQSRNSPMGDRVRQLQRFAEGMRLPLPDRYWRWAGYAAETEAMALLSPASRDRVADDIYRARRAGMLKPLQTGHSLNEILDTDMSLVLPNDMLTKVDLMSMANGLEIRVPFLDYRVVEFVQALPGPYKIGGGVRKRLLKDAFRDLLPAELYHRPKRGFEVPLLHWFRGDMRAVIADDLLSDPFVREQGIFDPGEVRGLLSKLFSRNPGDVHARIWALVVFQHWWKRYLRS